MRRSVRTHKSLVKVQALVRGHIVRRQAAITLRCMNALVRVQARARANAVRKSAAGMEVQQRLEAVGYRQKDGPGKKRSDVRLPHVCTPVIRVWTRSTITCASYGLRFHMIYNDIVEKARAEAWLQDVIELNGGAKAARQQEMRALRLTWPL